MFFEKKISPFLNKFINKWKNKKNAVNIRSLADLGDLKKM